MRVEIMIGLMVGLCIGLFLMLIFLIISKKDGKVKGRYDERQTNAQGKAFKLGFFVMLFYFAAYGLLDLVLEKMFLAPSVSATLGISLGIGAYASYSIWKDAYYALNERKNTLIWIFLFCLLINLIGGIWNVYKGNLIQGGALMMTGGTMNFIMAGLVLLILIVTGLKSLKDKREMEG